MVLVDFDGEQRLGQSEKSERQTVQRTTKFCKAIILQLKFLKNNKIIYIYKKKQQRWDVPQLAL